MADMTAVEILQKNPTIATALCTWQFMRRIGFASEDIHFAYSEEKPDASMVVFAQGRYFGVSVGPRTSTTVADWEIVASALNAKEVPDEVLETLWISFSSRIDFESFMHALIERGFAIPNIPETEVFATWSH